MEGMEDGGAMAVAADDRREKEELYLTALSIDQKEELYLRRSAASHRGKKRVDK
jgi:hypothetical protein